MTSRARSNADVFESDDRVAVYNALEGLTAAEQLLIDRWVLDGAAVLDLGVGTGRTVPALRAKASQYVGLDYSQAMVSAASSRFPGVQMVVGDAADLREFADFSFDAVVFSYNGLDYLKPLERRSAALAEIRRVLRPDGVFIMSTHNPRALLRPAPKHGGRLRRMAAAAAMTTNAVRSRGLAAATLSGSGYHADHVQGLETYFATPKLLARELEDAGFVVLDAVAGDHPRTLLEWRTPWTYVAAKPRPTGPTDMAEVTLDAFPEDGSELALSWDLLVSRTGDGPFQTRQWVEAWRSTLEPGSPVRVLVARRDAEVVGVLPVARLTRSLHRKAGLPLTYTGIAGSGRGAADHLGPVCVDEEVGAALLARMSEQFGEASLFLESLAPRWAAVAVAATGGKVVALTPCPVNERPRGGSFSDAWSSKARKNARRRDRMLADEGITAHWTGPGTAFPDALAGLRALHVDRWAAQGQNGLFPVERESLLNLYAKKCGDGNGPWILTLVRGGRPVAALLGIRFRDAFSVYKTGWAADCARLGLGVALGQEAMRWAEEQDLHRFDYLRGGGAHKSELGCSPRLDVSVIRPIGLSGRVLALREDRGHPLRSVTDRARPRVRRP